MNTLPDPADIRGNVWKTYIFGLMTPTGYLILKRELWQLTKYKETQTRRRG
jgi:hypothetical protein